MPDAPTTQGPAPEARIETIGPSLRRLTITISPDAIREKLEQSLGTLSGEATIPGFRKGRIPRALLEKRFGKHMRTEARSQLMAEAYAQVIEAHGIRPVAQPEPTAPPESIELEEGRPLTFSLDVEVAPEFEIPDLEGIEIRRPLLEITDELVQRELKRHLRTLGTPSRLDSGFRGSDVLQGHVTIRLADKEEPLLQADQALVAVPGEEEGGRGPVAGIMIEDLAARLSAAHTGETVIFEATGPPGHELEEVRGATISIEFRIASGHRVEPATIQEMIDRYGLSTEENLNEQLRLALEHQRDREQAAAMREQVYTHLLNHIEMELPEKLSAAQAARNLEGHRVEMMYRGHAQQEIESRLAAIRAESEEQTRRTLKLFFILSRLAEHLKVDVSEQEINGRISEMAAQAGQRPEALRAELARNGRIGEVARMIRDHKTADRIVGRAKVSDVSAEEWNKQMLAAGGKPPTPLRTRHTPSSGPATPPDGPGE
jgi:trigger factor